MNKIKLILLKSVLSGVVLAVGFILQGQNTFLMTVLAGMTILGGIELINQIGGKK